MEGLVKSQNGFYKPGEGGCYHLILAVLLFTVRTAGYRRPIHFAMAQPNIKLHTSIVGKFKNLWMYYFLQSSFAGIALFIIVLALGKDRMVAISAMGATAFIVFAMPTDISAQTRNVIGGHLVGLVTGTIFYFAPLPYFIEYPLVVGVAVFVMAALDVEHPPAAGTALAVVINEVYPLDVFVAVMVGAVILSQCRYYLRNHLKDLV